MSNLIGGLAYLHENGLQLATVFATVALGEEHLVGRDAVVGHPAVPLEHTDHDVRQTVLGLEHKGKGNEVNEGS